MEAGPGEGLKGSPTGDQPQSICECCANTNGPNDRDCPAATVATNSKRQDRGTKRPRSNAATKKHSTKDDPPLVQALRRIDPLLQFLCKATGQVLVDWTLLQKSLPIVSLVELQRLHEYGVLRVAYEKETTMTGGDISAKNATDYDGGERRLQLP